MHSLNFLIAPRVICCTSTCLVIVVCLTFIVYFAGAETSLTEAATVASRELEEEASTSVQQSSDDGKWSFVFEKPPNVTELLCKAT